MFTTGLLVGILAGFVLTVIVSAIVFLFATRRKRESFASDYEFDPLTKSYKRRKKS